MSRLISWLVHPVFIGLLFAYWFNRLNSSCHVEMFGSDGDIVNGMATTCVIQYRNIVIHSSSAISKTEAANYHQAFVCPKDKTIIIKLRPLEDFIVDQVSASETIKAARKSGLVETNGRSYLG